MPELPDVEVYRRYFNATALHQKINTLDIKTKKILENVSSRALKINCTGHSFDSTTRHGKYLFAQMDNGKFFLFHFGMTGNLKYYKSKDNEPDYAQLIAHFANGYNFAYISKRKLGKIFLIENIDDHIKQEKLGPDALNGFKDFESFKKVLAGRRGAAKTTLMNQNIIAGIGNIYSDGILFKARIHPKTKMKDLGEKQLKSLYKWTKKVLQNAIDNKMGPENFPPSYLLPHRHTGGKCPRCHTHLERIKVGQRSAYFCPHCQPLQ